jgi:two-component system, OmpR family, aerobic respiration control sensor histidine kinase ArcB
MDNVSSSSKDKTKEELQAELFRLKNVLQTLPGSIYWKDVNGVYLGRNSYSLKKMQTYQLEDDNTVDSIIGKTDYDLLPSNIADSYRKHDLEVMQTGNEISVEEPVTTPTGEVIVQLSTKRPLYDAQGKIYGIVGNTIDITHLKKIEEELRAAKEKAEAANKAKTEFLENMRHDIRTPLTGITGFASIIREETTDPKVKEYVDNLTASSDALLDLLNEILEVIKVSSGEIPILRKKFNLQKRLQEIINLTQSRARQKNIELQFDFDPLIPTYLIADSMRIHRTILELVSNALNFTDKGYVRLSAKLATINGREAIIKILVEDTGIGIEPTKQDEIYLRFKRLTPSYEGIYHGAGLGLAIVKQFIDELEGEIYVESELGKGTTFTCVLPLSIALVNEELGCEEIPPTPSRWYADKSQEKTLSVTRQLPAKSRVLVVEDHLIAAKIVANLISQLDCQVDIAADGKTGADMAKNNDYDIIFMDIGLPVIDGYETARRIRLFELSKGTHVPIIALTAHVDEENKQRCIQVGMNAVLSKPLTKQKAEDVLNAFIAYRQKRSTAKTETKIKEAETLYETEADIIDITFIRASFPNLEDAAELLTMLGHSLQDEKANLAAAKQHEHWQLIQNIVHKVKGSASYFGMLRLQKACNQLEEAIKMGHTVELDNLYQIVFTEMQKAIDAAENLPRY